MPTLGIPFGGGEGETYRRNAFEVLIHPGVDKGIAPGGDTNSMQTGPIVPDFTAFQQSQNAFEYTLADQVQGQDWLMKRIVGKIHLKATAGTGGAGGLAFWSDILVTFGIFVAKAFDDDQAAIDLSDSEIDPQNTQNIRNPWAFRRSWTLSSPTEGGANISFPCTTAGYNSVQDGPHVDIKVARRIRKEERLWYVVTCQGANVGVTSVSGTTGDQPEILGQVDLRVLGAMRRASSRSTF